MNTRILMLVLGGIIALGLYLFIPELSPFPYHFTSEKCDFSVVFPGKPSEEMKPVGENSVLVSRNVFSITKYGTNYRIECYEYKKPVQDESYLDGLIDDLLSDGYSLISKQDMEISGQKGKEVILSFNRENYVARSRMVIVGKRMYMISAIDKKEFIQGKKIKEYLDSFRIVSSK